MFADPATINISGVPFPLVRINQDKYSSEYLLRQSTQEFRLSIRNSSYLDKKRGVTIDRHNVELIQTVFPVAPSTLSIVRKTYAVIENQKGDTLEAPRNIAAALFDFCSDANIDKLMNYES
jgi:hypothetical protein